MSKSTSPPDARDSLRRLVTPHALDFGSRLLHRGTSGLLTFREFIAVAKEFVRERPEQSAVYLAALVALDMGAPEGEEPTPRPHRPSPN